MSDRYKDYTSTKSVNTGGVAILSQFNHERIFKARFDTSDPDGMFLEIEDGPVWAHKEDLIAFAHRILSAFES